MEQLRNSRFQLIENPGGHVSGNTVMRFGDSTDPCIATYSGPNIVFGQVIVSEDKMIYHALDTNGQLSAGKATVRLERADNNAAVEMVLDWQWLTGDRSQGVSRWKKLR